MRLAACAAAVAVLSLAPAATAAGASCHLVTDPKGDARVGDAPPGVYVSPDQDIVGGDIASNKRYVTGVVRLVSLRPVDTQAPTGRVYTVLFSVDGYPYSLSATYGPDGYQGSASDEKKGVGLGDASVVLDHNAREVRISAPAAVFGVRNGRRISGIAIEAGHRYGTNASKSVPTPLGYGVWMGGLGLNTAVDKAQGTKAYVAGTRSCVAVAR